MLTDSEMHVMLREAIALPINTVTCPSMFGTICRADAAAFFALYVSGL